MEKKDPGHLLMYATLSRDDTGTERCTKMEYRCCKFSVCIRISLFGVTYDKILW